jgi:hypothetical protein
MSIHLILPVSSDLIHLLAKSLRKGLLLVNLRGRRHLEKLGTDGRIIFMGLKALRWDVVDWICVAGD